VKESEDVSSINLDIRFAPKNKLEQVTIETLLKLTVYRQGYTKVKYNNDLWYADRNLSVRFGILK